VFAEHKLRAIRAAIHEVSWLLSRGYPLELAVRAAGDHHQLAARARMCVTRASASPTLAAKRRAACVSTIALEGAQVDLDAFNILVSLEVARGTGLLFRCPDGAIRDLAGLRGSYKPVDATEPAVALLVQWFAQQRVQTLRVWIDEPVSNSGQIRRMFELASELVPAVKCEIALVRDADQAMLGKTLVASADAMVIDRAPAWVNVVEALLAQWAPNAWVISLQDDDLDALAV
jgi:hypothetical protein